MKLPRWLFLGLLGLILLSPIAAVCIWWITWPERTARQFVALLGEGQLGEAHELMNNPSMMKVTKGSGATGEVDVMMFADDNGDALIGALPQYFTLARLKPLSVERGELIHGRRRFELTGGIFDQMPTIEIVAERGKVRVRWAPAARITNNGENE
jgi:hypothetical protein